MNLKLKHKRLYALLVVICLIVSATVLLTACRNNTGTGNNPQEPTYSEGPECGVYYYDVPDGEILLILSGGNKFTLTGPSENKTGSYTIDDQGKIVLDYIRDEDGTSEATLSGTTITLNRGGSSVAFIKKVNYTVTFNVNGGSEITTVTVVNGKTVAKPADPTRSGYAFLGWYSDGELKSVFDFATTTITSDVTIHAKWVPDQVGVGKYTVDFDLGYDGAPEYDAITTISGLAYGVPTPTREGYVFGGWWISMYEDGNKLSYEYTESTTFDSDTTLYAVWNQTAGTKLASPMASVTNNTIKWKSVVGANLYQVVITDAAGNEVLNETTGATTMNFDFAGKPAGDYVISVVAIAQDTANNSDATLRYIANKALAKVSQFQVIDGILIFNHVNGATEYTITVDCGNDSHKHTNFNNGSSTSFSLINCPMQAGGIKITVTASANGYASSVSETYVYDRVLDAIEAVVYNAQTDTFVWNAVPAATSYIVTVTVGDKTYTIDNGTKTYFSVAAYTGDITVSVKPANAGYNSPAATSANCSKVAPAIPTNVTVNGMIVSWNAASGAESYEIKIGDVIHTVNGTSYDLTADNLTAGQTYDISVKSIKGAESSAYTEAISFGYRVMNSALTYKNNTVYWIPAIGAVAYEVKVNGVVVAENVSGNSQVVKLTREGINTIEVRFTDVAGSAVAKIDVMAHAVTYYPRNNTAAFTEYYAVGDTMTLPRDIVYDGFDFSNWYTSPNGAAGNGKLYAEGTVFSEYGSIALFADWAPKTYNAILQTEGYGISNITDKTESPVVYTQGFTLPVPATSNAESLIFAGWFTGPAGTGDQLTDASGNSVENYSFTRDTVAYPYFRVVLSYVPQPDGTYGVKRGPDFDSATDVVIPVTYLGVPVTTIVENAFANRRNVETISIPDTIEIVGIGAFTGCPKLKYIDVYKVEGNHTVYYASDDGALVHYDMGATYLEVFPRAKTGTYVMSDDIQYITSRAFQYPSIQSVVIGKGVVSIAKYAFYICTSLETVEFAEGRTAPVVMEDETFHQCNHITKIKLPKSFNMTNESIATTLNRLKKLDTIEVERGNPDYAAVNGMLTSADRSTLIYAPVAITGENGIFTVPGGIRTIQSGAVANRAGFVGIVIPKTVTEIGSSAFANCINVSSVTFDGNRTSDLTIGSSAFAGLPALTTVIFNGNAEGTVETGSITIGQNAFAPSAEGASLSILKFNAGVNIQSIGQSAFANQTSLPTITYGENAVVKVIDSNAFANCTLFNEIQIIKSTTRIASNAFKGCTGVSNIVIAADIESLEIANQAFANCTNLRSINIPKNVTNFNGASFDGCTKLAEINVDPANPQFYSSNGVVYNAAKTSLIFYPKALIVEEIKEGDTVIKPAGTINNLIPTLTEITASVFESNTDLKAIVLPASVSKIGDKAFYKCSKLTSVTFDATGTTVATSLTVGANAFASCTSLTYGASGIILPDYTTSIGTSAFSGCTAIKELTIPAGITTISDSAFSGCTGITSLTIPSNITTIGKTAFKSVKIKTLVIPTSVIKIGAGAFESCTALTTVTVTPAAAGETVANLELGDKTSTTGVFKGCTALATVDLGDRVTLIGNHTFSGCNKTGISIDLGSKVNYIGDQAFYNVKLTSIHIPAKVTTIGQGAFSASSTTNGKLTSITFEMGNTTNKLSIGKEAFKNQASVTQIIFPARLNSIHTEAVSSNYKYTDVDTRFTGMSKLAKIDVEVIDGYNAKYSAYDGVLYVNDSNGNPATLLYCPTINAGNAGTVTIPKTVTNVYRGTFYGVTKINTIIFEDYAPTDAEYGKPLLTIGNSLNVTSAPSSTNTKYTVFGGSTSNTITKIVFPSHLATLNPISVGTTKSNITIEFGASTSIELAPYALTQAKFETINIPNVSSFGKGAFYKCAVAKSINFTTTDTLTEISASLFEGCTKLESYTVPASIKSIAVNAFKGCSGLKTLTFETGSKLEVINSGAFANCTGLTTVDLTPCTELESIGGEQMSINTMVPGGTVFSGCTSLKSIDLTGLSKLTFIGYKTFEKTALTSFTFPENIEEVGYEMFAFCESLTEVTLSKNFSPDMLSKKDNLYSYFMFIGCDALKTINVPESNNFFSTDDYGALYDLNKTVVYLFPAGAPAVIEKDGAQKGYEVPGTVKSIGNYAFAFFKGDSITLPDGLETIGDYAFFCNNFTTLTIPASVKTIGDAAFSVDDSTYDFADTYESKLTTVEFKPGSAIESIGNSVFYKAVNLTSIVLPDSLTTLGESAFELCESLTEIIIPASLKVLPRSCFRACNSLNKVTLQEGLELIDEYAFYLYDDVDESKVGTLKINVPSTVTVIAAAAFNGNMLLGEIIFPENSQCIEIGAITNDNNVSPGSTFMGSALKKVVLPASLETFANNTLQSIPTLEEVVFKGAEFKDLPTFMFRGCTNLKSVTLPEGLVSIGRSAFAGCEELLEITIPASVTSIGTSAFMDCTGLETVTFAPGSQLTSLTTDVEVYTNGKLTGYTEAHLGETNIFKNTTSLESVILPDSLKVIGGYAFAGSSLSEIHLPADLETVGIYAFAGTPVEEIVLPTSTSWIGDHAFDNCDEIENVTLLGNISYIGDSAFYDCDSLVEATPSFGLEYLGGLAFAYCEKLTVAYIPATVTQLGGNPYVGCVNAALELDPDNTTFTTVGGALYDVNQTTLYVYPTSNLTETVVLPYSVNNIAPGAFAGAQMKHIVYPARFGTIPDSMFAGCDKLETITIEEGITSIGDHAFDGCVSLTAVAIPNTVNYVGNYAFANCTNLSSPSFENKSTGYYELGTHIFYGCTSLTEAVLPNAWRITLDDAKACGIDSGDRLNPGPTTAQLEGNIPSYMFANSGVVTANLPARVTMLCTKGVFMNCANLTTVTFGATQLAHAESMLGTDYFAGCTSLPASFKPPYKTGVVGPVRPPIKF